VSKYLTISHIAFMDRLAMRSELFLGVAAAGVRLLVARILWQAVFAGKAELGGFDLPMMTSYYLIVSFIRQFDQSEGYVWEFASEIRNGTFGKYIVRPIDPLRHFLSVCAGRSSFQIILALIASLAWALPFLPLLAPLDPVGTLAALPVLLLGLVALGLVNYLTSLVAFVVQDITPYHMVKNSVIELFSGALIPVSFFPAWARAVLDATPFPALASLPAALMLGQNPQGYLQALAILALWVAGLYFACRFAYARLSLSYEEVGA
jgi:ABC-2 type transport system permease protein